MQNKHAVTVVVLNVVMPYSIPFSSYTAFVTLYYKQSDFSDQIVPFTGIKDV